MIEVACDTESFSDDEGTTIITTEAVVHDPPVVLPELPQHHEGVVGIADEAVLGPPECRPRITVRVGGRQCTALLDTGANNNFIRSGIVDSAVDNSEGVLRLRLAGRSSHATVAGKQRVSCFIGSEQESFMAYVVPDLREELILGCPFMNQTNATLDMHRHCAYLGKTNRQQVCWTRPAIRSPSTALSPEDIKHNLPEEFAPRLVELVRSFPDVFNDDIPLSTTATTKHHIRLKNATPVRQAPYRYSEETRRLILEQVEEMLQSGIIEASSSAYSSPIVIVTKKDGRPRFCVDFHRLNDNTEDEPAVLPIIQQTIKDLGTAKVFSALDLKSGYWQVPLTTESKPLTAFSTPTGAHYQFRVMPFGLKNAPATFQRMMAQEVLAGYLHEFVMVYLDDIVVYSSSVEEHLHHLSLVFERLHLHQLRCAPKKCVFGRQTIEYLGHIISSQGNQPKSDHLQAIQNAQAPSNKKQLRQFLGVCNWVREFCPKFAEHAAPLTDLLKNKQKFSWGPEQQAAFQTLKDKLADPEPLARPDPEWRMVLQTDASQEGMSAVLYQEDISGKKQIISYASARFSATERRYHANEQECMAVVWGIKKYRPYLEDRRFLLRTDNRVLTWLKTVSDQRAKLTRWAMLLQGFAYDIEHVPGRANLLPDFLSRHPESKRTPNDLGHEDDMVPPEVAAMDVRTLADEVREAQQGDATVIRFRRLLAGEKGERLRRSYDDRDGALMFVYGAQPKLYVVEAVRGRVLYDHHDSGAAGHPGTEETFRAIAESYHWPTMKKDVRDYVRGCLICAKFKTRPNHPRAGLRPRQPTNPFETVSLDLMGPYPETAAGHRYILVVTDLFSRWIEAFPLNQASVDDIVPVLETEVFSRYGYPRELITDDGRQFESRRWLQRCRKWKVLHWTTADYHPQANPTSVGIRISRKGSELDWGVRFQELGTSAYQKPWRRYAAVRMLQLEKRPVNYFWGVPTHLQVLGRRLDNPMSLRSNTENKP